MFRVGREQIRAVTRLPVITRPTVPAANHQFVILVRTSHSSLFAKYYFCLVWLGRSAAENTCALCRNVRKAWPLISHGRCWFNRREKRRERRGSSEATKLLGHQRTGYVHRNDGRTYGTFVERASRSSTSRSSCSYFLKQRDSNLVQLGGGFSAAQRRYIWLLSVMPTHLGCSRTYLSAQQSECATFGQIGCQFRKVAQVFSDKFMLSEFGISAHFKLAIAFTVYETSQNSRNRECSFQMTWWKWFLLFSGKLQAYILLETWMF